MAESSSKKKNPPPSEERHVHCIGRNAKGYCVKCVIPGKKSLYYLPGYIVKVDSVPAPDAPPGNPFGGLEVPDPDLFKTQDFLGILKSHEKRIDNNGRQNKG